MTIYKTTEACCELTAECFEMQWKLQRVRQIPAKMCTLTTEQLNFIEEEIASRYGLLDAYYHTDDINHVGECAITARLVRSINQAKQLGRDETDYWSRYSDFKLDHCICETFEYFLICTDDFLRDAISGGADEIEWAAALLDDTRKLHEILEVLAA